MTPLAYSLSGDEKKRLTAGIEAAFTIPVIDDVEDFVWEAVFHYVKNLRLPDPIMEGRSKKLFDAVAPDGRGWSLKTLVWPNHTAGSSFEFVIQRADIFKKAGLLGFKEGLDQKSNVANLGAALVRHWNQKYEKDRVSQGVSDPRIAILIKNVERVKFVYVEYAYQPLNEEDFVWKWSRDEGAGLKGLKNGAVCFKWYYGQKQLFQVFPIPPEAYCFEVNWRRASLTDFVEKVCRTLSK